jgi:hypothetical protein
MVAQCGGSTNSSGGASSKNSKDQQQQLGCFCSASAAAACQPSHLQELLDLLAKAERSCSKHQQQSPASLRLLHVTLDCCLLTWPAAAFASQVQQELLSTVVPALLGSARSLSQMAGLRAMHILLLRGLMDATASAAGAGSKQDSEGHAFGTKEQQQQQQTAPGAAPAHGVKQLQVLVEPVCLLLKSPDLAIRLEVSSSCSEQGSIARW